MSRAKEAGAHSPTLEMMTEPRLQPDGARFPAQLTLPRGQVSSLQPKFYFNIRPVLPSDGFP
jgi:hypothetical protein